MKNPKPDILHKAAFSAKEQEVNECRGACLSQNFYHPFFVVEAKSASKPLAEAAQQCARAGAAMVRLRRKFNSLARNTHVGIANQVLEDKEEEEDDTDQPITPAPHLKPIPIDHYHTDRDSFVFSLAFMPIIATLYVNWAEETFSKEGNLITINWHQHTLEQYTLQIAKAWPEFHRDLDNL